MTVPMKVVHMPVNLKHEAKWLARLLGRDAYITKEETETEITWRRRLPSGQRASPKWGKDETAVIRIKPDGTEERL